MPITGQPVTDLHSYLIIWDQANSAGDMKYLLPLKHWDRGFKSHSKHGSLCAFNTIYNFIINSEWGQTIQPNPSRQKKKRNI
jgi:hypothetical protein